MIKEVEMQTKDEQLAGGYVPRHIADRLGLLAVYRETTRSAILRQLLERSLAQSTRVEVALNGIAVRFFAAWKAGGGDFEEHKVRMVETLHRKKLSSTYIDGIVEKLESLYATDQIQNQ